MNGKIKLECFECGFETSVFNNIWEIMECDGEKRTCPLCGERSGLIEYRGE